MTLVSGPVAPAGSAGVATVHVESAREMLEAVEAALPADIGVFAAAVADWRVARGAEKIKKGGGPPALALVENPDILATIAPPHRGPAALVVGFAAETENVVEHARAKLARKGCDLIVANDVSPGTGVMGGDRNTVHLVTAAGVETWPTLDKDEVARRLVERLAWTAGARGHEPARVASGACRTRGDCRCRATRRRAPPASTCWRPIRRTPIVRAPPAARSRPDRPRAPAAGRATRHRSGPARASRSGMG